VEQPVESKVEARHVPVLSCCRYGFEHCCQGFSVAAKVGLEHGKVHESVLVVGAVSVGHGVVEISMKQVERGRIVSSSPGVKETVVVRYRLGDIKGLDLLEVVCKTGLDAAVLEQVVKLMANLKWYSVPILYFV
jgi:hypothetical protein